MIKEGLSLQTGSYVLAQELDCPAVGIVGQPLGYVSHGD
jgi:hypothetical protein